MNVLPTAPFTAAMPRVSDGHAPSEPVDVLRTRYAAVIFDMDGVVTDTAGVHARAWKKLFDQLLRQLDGDRGQDHRDGIVGQHLGHRETEEIHRHQRPER